MDKSPMGKLPPELRNKIYELVLVKSRPIYVKSCLETDPNRAVICTSNSERPELALLRTCKQIQQEATSILYHDNVFTFTSQNGDSALAFENFIKLIGSSSAASLRSCRVEGGSTRLFPTKCENLGEQICSWGKKTLDLSDQLPECSITGTWRFKVVDKIELYAFDFSSTREVFVKQWKTATCQALQNLCNVMRELCGLHYNDPRNDALQRLCDEMSDVAQALKKCFGELGNDRRACDARRMPETHLLYQSMEKTDYSTLAGGGLHC
ncbi:uncharacterized protein MYCFIDRAFT_79889 [Pseudocercospora fijiensis CIRAD86]|uniref:2EXR domain-containing protein n=1 Tax=Pseudocercospora fijiensis (strain CIRAD86) TaxID=383855 RepID=M3ANC5_PSEFD|nr:uncharacterized protein MYCFIDRAFT_79889 [Pseudocercospora fijiensis CIRAD86]EME78977.1 hypothetical protein MYCFIDRAFT_79889 [Pseudocercospora fijiensis CIRAD86]